MVRVWVIMAVMALSAGACSESCPSPHASRPHKTTACDDYVKAHVIEVGKNGHAYNPITHMELSRPEFDDYVSGILRAMDAYYARPERLGKTKRLLVFVHGGLNSFDGALASAVIESQQIDNDPETGGEYPIFVNWNSDLMDSYGEHLTSITRGRVDRHPTLRALMTPFYLLADTGRAITRAPVVVGNQIGEDIDAGRDDLRANDLRKKGDPCVLYSGTGQVAEVYKSLCGKWELGQGVPRVSLGETCVSGAQLTRIGAAYAVTSPAKIGTSWIVDGLGTEAWGNMSRRTLMMYEGDYGGNPENSKLGGAAGREQKDAQDKTRGYQFVGATEILAKALELTTTRKGSNYEVTLIGHSMGTMVLNEWIRRHRDGEYHRIIYMAAACSIRDWERSVIPYMRDHCNTEFYGLMLHPQNDLREVNGWDIPPRGSLLAWIDSFFGDPQTPIDRTLGRWDNIIPAVQTIQGDEKVRRRITLKAFPLVACAQEDDPEAPPQKHGSFRAKPYWRAKFRETESATTRPSPAEKVAQQTMAE